jgi:choline monooxygenase
MEFHSRVTYDIDCDWKTYVDNYLEGYHVGMVHPELAQVLDVSNYKYEATKLWTLQHSPIQNVGDGANPYGDGSGWAYYFFIFPNLMLNIVPGRVQTNVILPLGGGRCRVIFDYFYEPDALGDAARIKADLDFSDRVQQEDIEICAAVQRGLASGSYERGRYSPSEETALHHFHDQVRAAFRAARERQR